MEKTTKRYIKWTHKKYGAFEAIIIDGKLTDFMACEKKTTATFNSGDVVFLTHIRDMINDILKEVEPQGANPARC